MLKTNYSTYCDENLSAVHDPDKILFEDEADSEVSDRPLLAQTNIAPVVIMTDDVIPIKYEACQKQHVN